MGNVTKGDNTKTLRSARQSVKAARRHCGSRLCGKTAQSAGAAGRGQSCAMPEIEAPSAS